MEEFSLNDILTRVTEVRHQVVLNLEDLHGLLQLYDCFVEVKSVHLLNVLPQIPFNLPFLERLLLRVQKDISCALKMVQQQTPLTQLQLEDMQDLVWSYGNLMTVRLSDQSEVFRLMETWLRVN